MKFPSFARSKPASETNGENVTAGTVHGSSKNSSLSDEIERTDVAEKHDPERPVSHNPSIESRASQRRGEKIIDATPVEEAKALEKMDDEIEYPGGTKLAIITLALCLSVFCMALVCYGPALATFPFPFGW